MRAARVVASFLRGAFAPVDFLAVCLVRAMIGVDDGMQYLVMRRMMRVALCVSGTMLPT